MEVNMLDKDYFDKVMLMVKEIENLDKTGFEIFQDLIINIVIYTEKNISNVVYQKIDEIIISNMITYLIKILNSYLKLLSGSHKISSMILLRTILEIQIKIKYLLFSESDTLYKDFQKNSLISEKIYSEKIDGIQTFNKCSNEETKLSINTLFDQSDVGEISKLSRKKVNFPSIEKMSNELINANLLAEGVYDITYRVTSNYTHANWSALHTENNKYNYEKVDIRLISPVAIFAIDTFEYISEKKFTFDNRMLEYFDIVKKCMINLDKEYLYRSDRIIKR